MKLLYKHEKFQGTGNCINKFWIYWKSYVKKPNASSAVLAQFTSTIGMVPNYDWIFKGKIFDKLFLFNFRRY